MGSNTNVFQTDVDPFQSDPYFRHFGIKGMRWGVRRYQNKDGSLTPLGEKLLKTRNNSSVSNNKHESSGKGAKGDGGKSATAKDQPTGFSLKPDGSMNAPVGTTMQRVVYSQNMSMGRKSRPLVGMAYTSLTDYDNASYITSYTGDSMFGTIKGRDTILGLRATKPIKSPSLTEATALHSKLLLSDEKYRKSVRDHEFLDKISDKDMKKIKADPTGETAQWWYQRANAALAVEPSKGFPEQDYIRNTVKAHMLKNGFNAIRDEYDFMNGFSKSPMIILDPENSLQTYSVQKISDELRKTSAEKVKAYAWMGEDWVEKNLYD
jgi:hypothetical protein